jgi:hypothetical protein
VRELLVLPPVGFQFHTQQHIHFGGRVGARGAGRRNVCPFT